MTHTYTIKATAFAATLLFGALVLVPFSASASEVEKTDGFVCPVIKTENVLNAKNGGALGEEGYYTVAGPDVSVPKHATNGDGEGSPAGPFSKPGDTDYTAIWNN